MKIGVVHVVFIGILISSIGCNQGMEPDFSKQAPLMAASIPSESSPVVSAVLLECPKSAKQSSNPGTKSSQQQCEQQLMVNIRVNPSFHIEKVEKFLILDEVYDPRRRSKAKVMSPYLIEISRGEPVMMYPLEFNKSVKYNGETHPVNDSNNPNTNSGDNQKHPATPEQESLNRVIGKITDALSPTTKVISPNDKGPQESYKNHNSDGTVIQDRATTANATRSQVAFADYNIDEYDDENDMSEDRLSQYNDQRQIQDSYGSRGNEESGGRSKLKLEYIPSGSNSGAEINGNSRFGCDDQHQMANVGVENSLVRKIEGHSNIAQLGLVKANALNEASKCNNKMQLRSITKNTENMMGLSEDNAHHSFRKHNRHIPNVNSKYNAEENDYMPDLVPSQQQERELESARGDNEDFLKMATKPSRFKQRSNPKRRKIYRAKHGNRRHDNFKGLRKRRPGYNDYENSDYPDRELYASRKQNFNEDFKSCHCKSKPESDSEDSDTSKGNNLYTNYVGNVEEDDFSAVNSARRQAQSKIESDYYDDINEENDDEYEDSYIDSNLKLNDKQSGLNEISSNRKRESLNIFKRRPNKYANLLSGIQQRLQMPRNIKEIRNLRIIKANKDESHEKEITQSTSKQAPPTNTISTLRIPLSRRMQSGQSNVNGIRKYVQYVPMQQIVDSNIKKQLNNQTNSDSDKKSNNNNEPNTNTKNIENTEHGSIFNNKLKSDMVEIGSGQKKYETPKTVYNVEFNTKFPKKGSYSDGSMGNDELHTELPETIADNWQKIYIEQDTKVPTNNHYGWLPSYDTEPISTSKETATQDHADKVLDNEPLDLINQFYKYKPINSEKSSHKDDKNLYIADRTVTNPAYAKILDDQKLSITDKLRALESVDPHNDKMDRTFKALSEEVDSTYYSKPTAFPLPFIVPSYANEHKPMENGKSKRSFLLYDDLQMHDTFEDNDYNFDSIEHKRSVPILQRAVEEEDVQPCSSCGGKGKKPHGKTEQPLRSPAIDCNCRNDRSSCVCDPLKKERSVSDTWYSVFNMSAPMPFLTTKIRIFRKRRNTWWKIAPSITLNSLSGIFANANLSILFSSHVDIFQLEKSLRLQNHQLLIPKDDKPEGQNVNVRPSSSPSKSSRKINSFNTDGVALNLDTLNANPNTILAVESNNPNMNSFLSQDNGIGTNSVDDVNAQKTNVNSMVQNLNNDHGANLKPGSSFTEGVSAGASIRNLRKSSRNNGIYTIAELGYFPTSKHLLEQCPNDKNRLCLNMLDDKVPAYSIKVKMPFRENSLLHQHVFKVKITKIVTDATTKDALQVNVDLVNEGLKAEQFAIGVLNCPVTCTSAKSTVQKMLLPHIGETVTFLLPLLTNQKHKKFTCDVTVKIVAGNKGFGAARHVHIRKSVKENKTDKDHNTKEEKTKTVAVRQFAIESENRCFCIWECSCHCIPKLDTHVDYNACQKLTYKEEKRAGLLLQSQPLDNVDDVCINDDEDEKSQEEKSAMHGFIYNALMLLLIMILLGFLKAVLGRYCCKDIDSFGYDYVQPGRGYDTASKSRRFFANTFFFVVFPFLFWCKCFTPTEEDLLVASTEWQCSIIQEQQSEIFDDHYGGDKNIPKSYDYEDEDEILTQHIDRKFKNSVSNERLSGGRDVLDIHNRLSDLTLAFHDKIFDDEDDDDDEVNTKFILQALVESRESLKKLLRSHSSQQIDMMEECNIHLKEAEELVQTLKAAQIVYRTLDHPVGNVRNIPLGVKYCIQGYFLPSLGAEYEFVNYNPLAQCRGFLSDGVTLENLRPPIILCHKDFGRVYGNKLKVLEANDLSVRPPPNVPCINITSIAAVSASLSQLASEHIHCSAYTSSARKHQLEQNCWNPIEPIESSNDSAQKYSLTNFPLDEEEAVQHTHSTTSKASVSHYCSVNVNKESFDNQSEIDEAKEFDILSHRCDTIYE